MVNNEEIYFAKTKKIIYLKSKNYKKGHCQICGKRRKTTAHHLVPRRLKCMCPYLAEVRVRVCSECDDNFHPENRLIKESYVIKKQSQNISNLKEAVSWRNKKIAMMNKGIKKIKEEVLILADIKDDDFYFRKESNIAEKEGIKDGK